MPFDLRRLAGLCAGVGFDLARADAALVERVRLLVERGETFADAERMVAAAETIFARYDRERPAEAFTASERRAVVLGCLFSDVGKTGPAHADPDGRALVVDMFAVENVSDDTMPVARFFTTYFPKDAAARVARFAALGLDPSMTIRAFWNLHGEWTLAIAEAAGVPPEAVAAAATHHLLEDVNPQQIVGDDGRFTRAFGDNVAFDRAEKLVIVLDKYDALRRRAGRSHDEAVTWLRARLAKSERFCADPVFARLVDDVDTTLADAR